jgi:prepilin-type N-terminal cleavage/methylation domain-containing protein
MKQSLSRLRLSKLSSFTLIELLVVIAIIAILAAVLLAAGSMALKAAKRAKATNMAIQIQSAALGYYTEYSIYPVPANATAATDYVIADTDNTDWANLLYGLCGNVNPYNGSATAPSANVAPNTRAITFLTLRNTDVDVNNGPLNPLPPAGTAHPYFNIAINNSYSGILGVSPSAVTTLPNFATGTPTSLSVTGGSTTAGVAVWANCTGIAAPTSGTMSCNSAFWVHTY